MNKTMYSKNEIIKVIEGMFPNQTIMFAYYSGSKAYGTDDENSDIDVTVVLANLTGNVHMEVANLDLFVYGEDCYLDKQNLIDYIPLYNRVHIDDVLAIEQNLIYLNPDNIDQFNAYKNIKIENKMKQFLKNFIDYITMIINDFNKPVKRLYHVLRIRGLLDYYGETGKYEMVITEPWKTRMMTYKKNWNNDVGHAYYPMIKEQLNYIKNYMERL
jgi:hypothetical protein